MSEAMMAIATTEAIAAIKSSGKTDLVEVVSVAMDTTVEHWMCTDKDQRFLSAVAATMSFFGDGSTECNRIKSELESLRAMSNALSPSNQPSFDEIMRILDESKRYEPIGLMGLWRKAEDRAASKRSSSDEVS